MPISRFLRPVRCFLAFCLLLVGGLFQSFGAVTPVKQQWVALTNGPARLYASIQAMTVDSSGNIYVTGIFTGTGTSFDYSTAKYNSAGVNLWRTGFNLPGNLSEKPAAIAVDGDGNVYVTGTGRSASNEDDFVTIKYDANGQPSSTWADDGNGVGVRRYDGPPHSFDQAFALALDFAGNVFVAGFSVGDGTFGDIAVVKYDSTGQKSWVARYDGPGHDTDSAIAVGTDNSGNVYVAGTSLGNGTQDDFVVLKYASTGTLSTTWPDVGFGAGVRRYNGPGDDSDAVQGLAVTPDGTIYVTGFSFGTLSSEDITTIKYLPDGTQSWVARFDGANGGTDKGVAVRVGGDGDVYVAGNSDGGSTASDYVVLRYTATGVLSTNWADAGSGTGVRRYNALDNSEDTLTAMTMDPANSVFLTGFTTGTSLDILTLKYESSGSLAWTVQYNTATANLADQAVSIAVDNQNHLVVAGTAQITDSEYDFVIVKYLQAPQFLSITPAPQILNLGQGTTLTASATGSLPLGYQWQLNGVDINGATSPTLVVTNVTLSHGGLYTLVVTNAAETNTLSASVSVQQLSRNGSQQAVLTLAGPVGQYYQVDFATSLSSVTSWSSFTNFTLNATQGTAIDAGAVGQSRRFYRVRPQTAPAD